jgi:hypothetical protein
MRIDRNTSLILALLLPALWLSCSVKRKGLCYTCFDSTTNVQQQYLDANQATFTFDARFNPESQFKIVLAAGRDHIDSIEKADITESNDAVTVVNDWNSSIDLALLDGLIPGQSYAMALLEKNKFERKRIMEIKEFTTQPEGFPKTAGLPKVLQVKKEEATIVFPSAIDDNSLVTEMSYLIAVWKKELGSITQDDILQNREGIKVVQDWTPGTDQENQEFQIGNLEVETDYIVGILARDKDGQATLLPLRKLKTLDRSAPDADAVTLLNSTESSVSINWPAAQDDETPADRLEYRILVANALSSLENPETLNKADSSSAEPRILQDWTANVTQYEATGLTLGQKYHFAVMVRDLGKNLAVYRTFSTTLTDPNAPVFEGDSIELIQTNTAVYYPEGVRVIRLGAVGHRSSLAKDSSTAPDEIEYLAACSLDSSVLASWESIQNNPDKVTRSPWQKAVKKVSSYSLTLEGKDKRLLDVCNSPSYLDYVSSIEFNPETAELKGISPPNYANFCQALKKYEVEPQYAMNNISTHCRYSSVGAKLYAKVFARDAEGKMASIGPALLPYTWDTDAPRFAADPVLNSDGTMSWTPATDFFTISSRIEYRIVTAASSEAIDSVEEVAAIASPETGLVMDWTANLSSAQLNILPTTPNFTLVLAARDELGNMRLAAAVPITDEAPQVGAALTLSDFVFDSLLLSWGAATDDKTVAADLSYKVVRAVTASELNTAAKANARIASDVLMDWTKAATSHELTGSQLATGALAVLVRDSVGQIALYEAISRSGDVNGLELYFDSGNTASYPGSGTIWKDLSGNGFDSTMYGGVAFLSSDGGVMDFDGVDDYVLLGNLSALKPTAAISVSQWLAPDSWTGLAEWKTSISCTQGAGYAILINTKTNPNPNPPTNSVQFQVAIPTATNPFFTYNTAAAVTDGFTGWKHVTGTFDGRYTKIYINGNLISTTDAGATYSIKYIQNGILIGAEATNDNTPHTANWWSGKIGPTLIRSRAMTADEVLAEFNASKARFGL